MDKNEAILAVKKYCKTAWPVSSASRDGCWRKAWGESRLPNLGLNLFMELVQREGFSVRLFGENVYILQLPGPSKKLAEGFIRCEGL